MLKNLLIDGARSNGFDELIAESSYIVFRRGKQAEESRFLIVKELSELGSVDDLHQEILGGIADEIKSEPSFSKNCDLVLVHKINSLKEYKTIENMILTYEENPYHFKKYFLYISELEEEQLKNKSYDDLISVINDTKAFENYKKNPVKEDPKLPSLYALAARVFIKVPFLQVPRNEHSYVPLDIKVRKVVIEEGFEDTFDVLSKYSNTTEDAESLVQELINEELENLKITDNGV